MRGLVVCICMFACGAPPPPRPVTPVVEHVALPPPPPRRERIESKPLTIHVRVPHGPTVVYLPGSPPYDGPSPTARLSTNAAVAATASALARERLAAIAEGRRVYEATMRQRAAVERNAPDAEARLQKISDERDRKIARVDARRQKATSKLVALLDKHAATTTIEGDVLRAELYLALADDELEKKLREQEKSGSYEDVKPDLTKPRQIIDETFTKHPAAERNVDARLSRALVYHMDDTRTGALLLLQFARDFPASRFVESAYHQAGHSLFGDPDPLAQTNALEAFRWLVDRASTEELRTMARFRLGQLHDRAREWPQAIAQLCKVVDTAKPDTIVMGDVMTYLGRAIARGGVAPLRPACAASQACPCNEQVLVDAGQHFRNLEQDAELREIVDLGRTYFSQSRGAAEWSCDLAEMAFRRGDDAGMRAELSRHEREALGSACVPYLGDNASDAELVRRHFLGSQAVTTCAQQALEERRLRSDTKVTVEISIDGKGRADKTVVQSPDPDTSDCIRAWIGRHRWHDLANTVLVVPLVIEL